MIAALGRYEVIQPLATGGMAELFLARTRGTAGFEKVLVVKRILPTLAEEPDVRAMFLDEARLAAMLEHPNIVQVFDLGEDGGELYFAMEYVHGSDVRRLRMARPDVLPVETAIEVVVQAAAGLHYAHELTDRDGASLALVHRDVSPSNLLCTWQGNIKVADFGIAKAMTRSSLARTRTGALRGKVMYMSPEQAKGEPLDRRGDVFSLGIVLWELIAGRRLYDGDHDYALLHQVTTTDAPALSSVRPDCPAELDRIVRRALARDREARYPTAAAMRHDLVQFVRAHGLAAGPELIAREMNARLGPATPLPVAPQERTPQVRTPRAPTAETELDDESPVARRSKPRSQRRLAWLGGMLATGGAAVIVAARLAGSGPTNPREAPAAANMPEPAASNGAGANTDAAPVANTAPMANNGAAPANNGAVPAANNGAVANASPEPGANAAAVPVTTKPVDTVNTSREATPARPSRTRRARLNDKRTQQTTATGKRTQQASDKRTQPATGSGKRTQPPADPARPGPLDLDSALP